MDDLIRRQDAIKDYQNMCLVVTCEDCPFLIVDGAFKGCRLGKWLKCLPSAEPDRKKGKWETEIRTNRLFGHKYAVFACSICGIASDKEHHFCPNCGAEMH